MNNSTGEAKGEIPGSSLLFYGLGGRAAFKGVMLLEPGLPPAVAGLPDQLPLGGGFRFLQEAFMGSLSPSGLWQGALAMLLILPPGR